MKKLILVGLSVLFLAACGNEEEVVQEDQVTPVEETTEEEAMSFEERVSILENMVTKGSEANIDLIVLTMYGYTPIESTDNKIIFNASELDEKDLSQVIVKMNADGKGIEEVEYRSINEDEVPEVKVTK